MGHFGLLDTVNPFREGGDFIAFYVYPTLLGAASRTAAVRTGEVAEGQAALREATSEASTGLAGRLIESRPQQWMLS